MGHEPGSNHSKSAKAADLGCCEITSSEPTPNGIATRAAQTSHQVYLEPVAGGPLLERPIMPLLHEASPPRQASSPLTKLYCTFLI
jgi:hypothetical protein